MLFFTKPRKTEGIKITKKKKIEMGWVERGFLLHFCRGKHEIPRKKHLGPKFLQWSSEHSYYGAPLGTGHILPKAIHGNRTFLTRSWYDFCQRQNREKKYH